MAVSDNTQETSSKRRTLSGIPRKIAFVIGFSLTGITLYTALRGLFLPIIQRSVHLCLLLALIFLWYPASKKSPKDRPSIMDWVCSILSLLVLIWTLLNHERFLTRIPYYSEVMKIDMAAGIVLVLLVLEGGRRTLGWTITSLAGLFIVYAFAGPYMPSMLAHRGLTIQRFADHMYLTAEGLFSSLTGLSATLLFAFISFGTFLQATNADKYFIDLCLAIAGKKPGGPAKVAILSSAAMGTISGSTIANVLTTGTLTIPLMIKTGYKPNEAGAIETAASAAGQIMPPIMGTGAFILAETVGVKYLDVVKVSFLPAIIFYMAIWSLVDIKAKKRNIRGLDDDSIPNLRNALWVALPLLTPILLLIVLLAMNFTPFLSATACTALIVVFGLLKKETRISFKKFILALEQCAIGMTSITGIIACAAIIVGMINITGLMMKTTSIILHLSGGYLALTILLVAAMAYLLGMGLPIATSYVILSTLGAPAMVELGAVPIAAHLMIFWFCQLATITPPVCMTAFAAAAIAEADPMKTGFTALKFGSPFYIVPILFIYSNILTGSLSQMIITSILAIIAIYFLACAAEGYFITDYSLLSRMISVVVFTLLYASTFKIFTGGLQMLLISLGLVSILGLFMTQKMKLKQQEKTIIL